MKKIIFFTLLTFTSASILAQAGKEKNKDKGKPEVVSTDKKPHDDHHDDNGKNKTTNNNIEKDHNRKVWEGVKGSGECGIPSKNQPAKVRASFQRDYPNVGTVTWTKCRGDWTATFLNGIWRSTAVYHANGQRRDTRTPVNKSNLPRVILDDIVKKRPGINIGNIIRIDLPVSTDPIFRVKVGPDTTPEYIYYNPAGVVVNYTY